MTPYRKIAAFSYEYISRKRIREIHGEKRTERRADQETIRDQRVTKGSQVRVRDVHGIAELAKQRYFSKFGGRIVDREMEVQGPQFHLIMHRRSLSRKGDGRMKCQWVTRKLDLTRDCYIQAED